ncbi:hypothetical protein NWO25_07260 [Enterococcus lactis]|nr:hypothetical protein [Enterococcus lactis]
MTELTLFMIRYKFMQHTMLLAGLILIILIIMIVILAILVIVAGVA